MAASKLKERKFELKDNAQAEELDPEITINIVSDVWPEPPPDGLSTSLSIYRTCPALNANGEC